MTALQLYELRRRIISVLYPNRCPFCGEVISSGKYYCKTCYENLPFAPDFIEPPANISELVACCNYCRRARGAVLMLKFRSLIYPADAFGLMMAERLKKRGITADIIVPVPSGKKAIERRGFSSAKVIAKRISYRMNIPICEAVCAVKNKVEQKSLTAKGRAENAKKCFYFNTKSSVEGKRVLLVDDVTTTGSTLSAVAGILLKAGAAEVVACVFARTLACTSDGDNNILLLKKPRGIRMG